MFWGRFSYYERGLCYAWKDETTVETHAVVKVLDAWNTLAEEVYRRMWEITAGMRRTGLRNKPRKKPVWKHTKKNGAFVRTKDCRGIDQYKYQEEILKKLLPFTKLYMLAYPDTIAREGRASCHASDY